MDDRQRITRRQAVSRASRAGALAAVGSLLIAPRSNASDTPQTDGQLLYSALAVEQLVMAVYERVIAAGRLSVDNGLLVHRLLSYERVHARVLTGELRVLGVAPPPSLAGASASSLDAILVTKQVTDSVANLGSESDGLRLLVRVEEVAEGAYYHAISKLADPRLALRSAQIMASEAQHRTLLSLALDPGDVDKAVPVAFVQGRG
jgi:Ferritin-like domain